MLKLTWEIKPVFMQKQCYESRGSPIIGTSMAFFDYQDFNARIKIHTDEKLQLPEISKFSIANFHEETYPIATENCEVQSRDISKQVHIGYSEVTNMLIRVQRSEIWK